MTMPDRELPPYVTQHNLAPPAKLQPAREPGLEPDTLATSSYHQRHRRYRTARQLIDRLIGDDVALAHRIQEVQKASFPSGTVGGGRGGGKSDPTARAAMRDQVRDPAERALEAFEAALRHLHRADSFRVRALAMTRAEGMVLEEEPESTDGDDRWCTNCIDVLVDKRPVLNPRGLPKDVGKDSTLCRPCREFERTYGFPMPGSLIRKRARQGKLHPRDVEKALRTAQGGKAHG